MTDFIKQFIESNILNIERNDYNAIFQNYYNKALWVWSGEEEEIFLELIAILKIVNPSVIPDSNDARYEIIYAKLNDVFHDILEDMTLTSNTKLRKMTIINMLNSRLGFTDGETEQIADAVASTYNLEDDFDSYYVG